MIFKDRQEAGKLLSEKLVSYTNKKDAIVLSIPRGGTVLGSEVVKALNLPLDIIVTRKIGHPLNPEFAAAAVDQEGNLTLNPKVTDVKEDYLAEESQKEVKEIERRLQEYRGSKPKLNLKDKVVVIIDDGIATGLTTLSAIRFVKHQSPKKTVLAIPVMPLDSVKKFQKEVDELIYLDAPEVFWAVGQFYENFPQTTDEEVKKLLT